MNNQGRWPALQDEETSALLPESGLAKSIHIIILDTSSTVNPDEFEDIVATGDSKISMLHAQSASQMPTCTAQWCTMTLERLQILHVFISHKPAAQKTENMAAQNM